MVGLILRSDDGHVVKKLCDVILVKRRHDVDTRKHACPLSIKEPLKWLFRFLLAAVMAVEWPPYN